MTDAAASVILHETLGSLRRQALLSGNGHLFLDELGGLRARLHVLAVGDVGEVLVGHVGVDEHVGDAGDLRFGERVAEAAVFEDLLDAVGDLVGGRALDGAEQAARDSATAATGSARRRREVRVRRFRSTFMRSA